MRRWKEALAVNITSRLLLSSPPIIRRCSASGQLNSDFQGFLTNNLYRQSLSLFSDFPYDRLFARAECPSSRSINDLAVRVFYLANPIVKSLIENNDFVRMRLLHAGAKVLARQDKGEVQFRILDEGLETTLPYLKENEVVHGNSEDLKPLLREQYPFFNKFQMGNFRSSIETHGKFFKLDFIEMTTLF